MSKKEEEIELTQALKNIFYVWVKKKYGNDPVIRDLTINEIPCINNIPDFVIDCFSELVQMFYKYGEYTKKDYLELIAGV